MDIQVRVYKFLNDGSRKDLYQNVIKQDPSIQFPFEHFIKVFSLLYPGTFIEFSIHL